jgi:biopolymer transport protein ExbD
VSDLRSNHNRFVALTALLAVALTILLALEACARQGKDPSQASAPNSSQAQNNKLATPAKIQLNAEEMGTSDDTSLLDKKLKENFQLRKEQHAFKRGFERRDDLRFDERIDKTVFVKAERSINLEEVTKIIAAFEDAGAEPVLLPITVDEAKARRIKPNAVRLCSACALAKDRRTEGEVYPNPLTLLVRLRQPDSTPPRDASGLPSMSDFLISDGIPIIISSASNDESLAMITIAKDGEYTLGEKHFEKAALENEIRDRIKAKPVSERVVYIKAGPNISYGSLEDNYLAAFAAGANQIRLDTGEQTIKWEEQGMKFTLPAGWHKKALLGQGPEMFRFEGPGGATLSIWVRDNQEGVDVEEGLRKDYEFRLKRQQSGELDEVRYLELDGVKGLLSRYSERKADEREINLQWQAFRRYKGKLQFVSIGLWGSVNGPTERQRELSGILYSTKLIQN